jgi:plasmid stabilization system protein ParE
LNEDSVRELFVSRYRLIYEVFEDRVAVLRVIHASRDFLAAWKPKDSTD